MIEEEEAGKHGYDVAFSSDYKYGDRAQIQERVIDFIENHVARALARLFNDDVAVAHKRLSEVTFEIVPREYLIREHNAKGLAGPNRVTVPAEFFTDEYGDSAEQLRKHTGYHEVLGHITDQIIGMSEPHTEELSGDEWEEDSQEENAEMQALKAMIADLHPDTTDEELLKELNVFMVQHNWSVENLKENIALALEMEQTKLSPYPPNESVMSEAE